MTLWESGPSEVEPGRRLYAHELERRLLDGVGVRPGDSVLELAAGFGATCLALAERVRPGGRTICSDIRPDRVAAMWRLVKEFGADDVDVRRFDMLRIDLPDACVDGILCRWGFMFPLPVETAFAEALRVLRPGRRLALATWADPSRNPWIGLVDDALVDVGLSVPADRRAPGQMFSLSDPMALRSLLEGAGFERVHVDEAELGWEYDSFEAWWDEEALVSGPYEDALVALQPEARARLQTRLRASLAPYGLEDGYRVPGVALVAIGIRPVTPDRATAVDDGTQPGARIGLGRTDAPREETSAAAWARWLRGG